MLVATVLALAGGMAMQVPVAPGSPAVEAVQLTVPAGSVTGTLVVPAAARPIPVVLIIAGSGPTDRDGNSLLLPGRNDAYKMLADALAAEGVASLRYDKRGIGASRAAGGNEASLRFEMYVDDAAAWVAQLRTDSRFSRVIVAGHSEGSLIGMLAASKAKADAFVSIAGVARRASDALRDQMRPQIGTLPALWEANEAVLASLERGAVVAPLPKELQSIPGIGALYRPSVQPYLVSWFKYVPSAHLATMAIPVLILQGTTDIQVSVDEARALKAAKTDADLVVVEGMNHVLKRAPADRVQNIATYSNPGLPIAPEVPRAIIGLARRIAGQ